MVTKDESVEIATDLMNSMSINEDDKQDIYLMIIQDFEYLSELDKDQAESLIQRLIKAYINRPSIDGPINFKDGFGLLMADFTQESITEKVRNIINTQLYPEEKDIVNRVFGLEGYEQQTLEGISVSMNKPLEQITETYNTGIDVIKMILNVR